MKILEVKNLSVGFEIDEKFYQAVFDVDFSLNKGETLAIVGESGCGKSVSTMSILKLLDSNAKITSGKIIFEGKNLLNLTEKELEEIRGKKIALIPQDPMSALNPLYTIENQLLEVIELHQNLNKEDAKKRALEALKEVKIPDAQMKMKAYPHELSGGMKQRVIIAMALACEAEIIIADEPTTALDVTVQSQIMDLLNEIRKNKQASIILITHDLNLVYENAQNVIVMYNGRIVEKASTKELIKSPKHPYTKALLNSLPSLNTTKLQAIQGQPPSITDEIPGCPFSLRCSECFDKCKTNLPELIKVENAEVACFKYEI